MSRSRYDDLKNKAVVISGGASGIGRAVVESFVAQGSRVAFIDIDEDSARELVRLLPDSSVAFFACDVRDPRALASVAQAIDHRLGPVSVVVNNAANDVRHDMDSVTSDVWDELMAINLKHQFFLTQALAGSLERAGGGSVINLSSISWRRGIAGLPVYVTCKAAVEGLTRALARDLGPRGIRVNSVLPGMVPTERQRRLWLTPDSLANGLAQQCLKIHVEPEDVAQAILWLASSAARAVTSQAIIVDAGWVF